MPTYRIKDPATGRTVRLTGDSPPTEQELEQVFSSMGGEKKSMMGKAWDALAIPEQKSREGLEMIAGAIPKNIGSPTGEPTGNMARDLAAGTPRIVADTMAEAAPSFVSRGSLLMGGAGQAMKAVKPLVRPVMRGLGRQGESLSGAMPGSLEAAYKDAGLMFGKGRKAASEAYETAKAGEKIEYGANLTPARKFFNSAYTKAQAGTLKPLEALEARKIADDLYESGSYVGDEILQKRKVIDAVAKKAFEGADTGFKKALQSESLRNILPQNKYGGTSAFKTGIMTALKAMGGPGKVASMAISPAVQGTAATAAGAASRQLTPRALAALAAALSMRRNQNAKR